VVSLPRGQLHNDSSGEEFVLDELSTIGRSPSASVPILDPRVSRRHAMIRRQDDGFWFFDLGSFNGSTINGRRVTSAQLLVNGDVIRIADHQFRFVGGEVPCKSGCATSTTDQTIADTRSRDVTLLVSDIQGFTTLSERLPPDQLGPIIGSWYKCTEDILERHGATIDKFMGDCALAYWLDTSVASRRAALRAAHEMRKACEGVRREHHQVLESAGLGFASGAAVHLGPVIYGAFSPSEFTLLGDAVNLAFSLEALTRTLNQHVLGCADVLVDWSEGLSCCRSLGSHPVKGRDQAVEVYALDRDPAVLGDSGP
jgi:class 3 adenylate cyclase